MPTQSSGESGSLQATNISICETEKCNLQKLLRKHAVLQWSRLHKKNDYHDIYMISNQPTDHDHGFQKISAKTNWRSTPGLTQGHWNGLASQFFWFTFVVACVMMSNTMVVLLPATFSENPDSGIWSKNPLHVTL